MQNAKRIQFHGKMCKYLLGVGDAPMLPTNGHWVNSISDPIEFPRFFRPRRQELHVYPAHMLVDCQENPRKETISIHFHSADCRVATCVSSEPRTRRKKTSNSFPANKAIIINLSDKKKFEHRKQDEV